MRGDADGEQVAHAIVTVVVNERASVRERFALDARQPALPLGAAGAADFDDIVFGGVETGHQAIAAVQDVPGRIIVDVQTFLVAVEDAAELDVVAVRHNASALVRSLIVDDDLVHDASVLDLHDLNAVGKDIGIGNERPSAEPGTVHDDAEIAGQGQQVADGLLVELATERLHLGLEPGQIDLGVDDRSRLQDVRVSVVCRDFAGQAVAEVRERSREPRFVVLGLELEDVQKANAGGRVFSQRAESGEAFEGPLLDARVRVDLDGHPHGISAGGRHGECADGLIGPNGHVEARLEEVQSGGKTTDAGTDDEHVLSVHSSYFLCARVTCLFGKYGSVAVRDEAEERPQPHV